MISFRCGRCTEVVKVDDAEAGRAVACPRCQHLNLCPSPASVTPAAPRRVQPPPSSGSTWAWIAIGVMVIIGGALLTWSLVRGSDASAAPAPAARPAEALQQELLRKNAGQPGDPILNRMYADLRAQHFADGMPLIAVRWEPRLAEVGKLSEQSFTLEGMFGHAGRQSVILLNPDLQANPKALARALSHEVVHAYLFSKGDTTSDHGPAFQAVLSRLASEGAFEGIVSNDDDRKSLRAWLDAESTRLDAEHQQFETETAGIERERNEVERALSELNGRVAAGSAPSPEEIAAVTARRDAYNAQAIAANERADRDRRDIDYFNREVARYNLMLVYPDGLDQKQVIKTRPVK